VLLLGAVLIRFAVDLLLLGHSNLFVCGLLAPEIWALLCVLHWGVPPDGEAARNTDRLLVIVIAIALIPIALRLNPRQTRLAVVVSLRVIGIGLQAHRDPRGKLHLGGNSNVGAVGEKKSAVWWVWVGFKPGRAATVRGTGTEP